MAKYHLKDNGEPGKCSAFKRPCPLGAPEDEHYPSKDAAREAYEKKMNAPTPTPVPRLTPEEQAAEIEYQQRRAETSQAVLTTIGSMATPEAVAQWQTAPVNSFKYRLAKMVKDYQEKDRTPAGDDSYATLVMMSAAGERSNLSTQIRKWTKEKLDLEMEDELNRRYAEALEGMPLEHTNNPRVEKPYLIDRNRVHKEETFETAIQKAKTDLDFVAPLCEAYDHRFFGGGSAQNS